LAGVISGLFAVTTTYLALILTGGQFTVSAGYALMPLALWLFYRALRQPAASRLVLTALCLSVQMMYDVRSTYLTLGVLLLFALYYTLAQRSFTEALHVVVRMAVQCAIVGIVVILIHAFWLLPGHFAVKMGLPTGYDATRWVDLLSYMRMSHAFALYHPWWYSQADVQASVDPIFLLLPLVIFLILLRKHLNFVDLFLLSTAIVAIFLVKGSNSPSGLVYDWLFTHVQGFSMYRDPSKFFQPLGLAYALLLGRAAVILPIGKEKKTSNSCAVLMRAVMPTTCIGLVLLQALPVAANTRWGTLAPQFVPADYIAYNRYIDRQSEFFRVLWYPGFYPFESFSSLHPIIGGNYLGQPTSWPRGQALTMLRVLSVKYLAVADFPDAAVGYRSTQPTILRLVRRLFPSFPEIRIGAIHLFVNRSYLPAVFVPNTAIAPSAARILLPRAVSPLVGPRVGVLGEYTVVCHNCVTVTSLSPTRYELITRATKRPFLLILNQSYDPNWAAYVEPSVAPQPFWWTWTHPALPRRYHLTVNGFANAWWINAPGTHRIILEFWPQRLTDMGWVICWLTIMVCLVIVAAPGAMGCIRRHVRGRPARDDDVDVA
jgi:hypothetical protein